MNFNKNYPIAILDTNIVMDFPDILDILKGCNIVIPYTLIEEVHNHKFVDKFVDLSEKVNLSKNGYKLENDCMLYLDIDKNNLHHKEINLDSKKQAIKFITEAKNLKEKYNDMEVVLISSDKIMKITASNFDVEVKTLEEFISKYIKDNDKNIILDILYNLYEEYSKNSEKYLTRSYCLDNGRDRENLESIFKIINYTFTNTNKVEELFKLAKKLNHYHKDIIYGKIFEILSENKDIDGLYKLAESKEIDYNFKGEIYEKIYNISKEKADIYIKNKDIDGLYKLAKHQYKPALENITDILTKNRNIDGLYKLAEEYRYKPALEKISNILEENKDIENRELMLKMIKKN